MSCKYLLLNELGQRVICHWLILLFSVIFLWLSCGCNRTLNTFARIQSTNSLTTSKQVQWQEPQDWPSLQNGLQRPFTSNPTPLMALPSNLIMETGLQGKELLTSESISWTWGYTCFVLMYVLCFPSFSVHDSKFIQSLFITHFLFIFVILVFMPYFCWESLVNFFPYLLFYPMREMRETIFFSDPLLSLFLLRESWISGDMLCVSCLKHVAWLLDCYS